MTKNDLINQTLTIDLNFGIFGIESQLIRCSIQSKKTLKQM